MEITTRTELVVTVESAEDSDLSLLTALNEANDYIKEHPPEMGWLFEDVERVAYNKIKVYYTR